MYLKVEITETGIKCVGSNTMSELCMALTVLISGLYENLPAKNRGEFKFCIKKAIEDDLPFIIASKDKDKKEKDEALEKFGLDSIFELLKGRGLKDD